MKPRSRRPPPIFATIVALVFLNQLYSSGDFVEQSLQILPSAIAIELMLVVVLFVFFVQPPTLLLWGLAAASAALFALRVADIAIPWFFGRNLNAAIDARFVPFFVKLLADSMAPLEFAALAALGLAVLLAAIALVRAALQTVWRTVAMRGWSGLVLGFAVLGVGWFWMPKAPSTPDARPVISADALGAATSAVDSVLRAEGLRGAHRARLDAAQATLPAKSDFAPLGGRSVVLIFIESYGLVTAREPVFAAPMDRLRADLQIRLDAAGFASATGLLRSPITGGGSWMAHGTLLAGAKIAAQDAYEVMLVSGIRTLAHRFAEAGYRTLALMPRIDLPWPEGKLLGFGDIRLQPELHYRGPRFAWESLPDQWVLARFGREDLKPAPLFAKIVLASSHTPFERVPAYVEDWATLAAPEPYMDLPVREFPVRLGQIFEQDAGYLAAVSYALESVVRFAAERTDDETLFVVLGDHQPPLTVARKTGDFSVPIHVFSRKAELVAPFQARGYVPGLQPPAGTAMIGMEDFLASFLADFGAAP
jgi:hypothetical protein